MDEIQIKKIIKNEVAPLLIGIRNDLENNQKSLENISEELKKKSNLEYELEVDDRNYKGEKGDKGDNGDSPSDQTILNLIKPLIPKKGKDYFNDQDIKELVRKVRDLLPSKEELKGKDGVIDYSTVKELAQPLIDSKYKEVKGLIDGLSDKFFEALKKAERPDITAFEIRDKLESLKGKERLDAKAIKNLEKFIQTIIVNTGNNGSAVPVSLQNAYNNSDEPEIITNSTLGAVTFRRGSSADTDTVIEVQNGAGTTNFSVTGSGMITGENLRSSSTISSGLNSASWGYTLILNAPSSTTNISATGTGSFAGGYAEDYFDGLQSEWVYSSIRATGTGSFAWGYSSYLSGSTILASGNGSVVLGGGIASALKSVVLGGGTASGASSVAMSGGTASGVGSVAIAGSTASGQSAIAFGTSAQAYGQACLTIFGSSYGLNSISMLGTSTNTRCVAIGVNSVSSETDVVSLSNNLYLMNVNSFGATKLNGSTFPTVTGTGWSLGANWTITGGAFSKQVNGATTISQTSASMVTPLIVGEMYRIQINYNLTVGSFTISCGGATLGSVSQNFNQVHTFVAVNTNAFTVTPSNDCRVTINGISLNRITAGELVTGGTVRTTGLKLYATNAISWAEGDVTITHATNQLSFAGATTNGYRFSDGPIAPATNDGIALGTTALSFSDLFLASGAVLNFANGNWTATHSSDTLTIGDGDNFAFATGTGTKFGTATTQKIGFFNATPVAQQIATTDLGTVLSNLGLRAAGTAYPITTSGATSFTGTIGLGGQVTVSDAVNFALNTTTGTKIGTTTGQKLGFWNKTPVIQQVTNAYTTDPESSAYTGIDNLQVGTPYAQLTDVNALRVAYENLRVSYDDLLTKLKNTGIVA